MRHIRKIDVEKLTIENMRKTAMEDITSMQNAWADEKQTLEQRAYEEGFQVGHEEGRSKAISEMTSSIRASQ